MRQLVAWKILWIGMVHFSVVSTKALHVGYGMGRHAGKPLGIQDVGRKSWQKITEDLQW